MDINAIANIVITAMLSGVVGYMLGGNVKYGNIQTRVAISEKQIESFANEVKQMRQLESNTMAAIQAMRDEMNAKFSALQLALKDKQDREDI